MKKKKMKERIHQFLFILSYLGFCWLMMQVVHESGHVIFAWLTGGRVESIVLNPLAISRTDLAANPHPLLQVWGGPLIGVALPLLAWAAARLVRIPALPLFSVFAGFCCIANGLYIGFGPDTAGADTHIMLSLGCRRWQLVVFGVGMLALGLWLLNGTGRYFGIGVPGGNVSHRRSALSLAMLAALILAELLLDPLF